MSFGKSPLPAALFGGIFAALLLTASPAIAAEMVYQFNNPSFGGNPLNGTFLLNSANVQNDFTEDKDQDLLADFEEQLARRILSDISRKITQDALGTDELAPGNYTIGDFVIDVTGEGAGALIEIFDTSTGGSTIIQIPGF